MKLSLDSTIVFPNSVHMPRLGLGVYKIADGNEIKTAVRHAVSLGYRHFDTASFYGNEAGLGQGLNELIHGGIVSRSELFITTKIWNDDQGYDKARRAIEKSHRLLGLGPLDLHLVHWPVRGYFQETWRALEASLHDGAVRAIGVSNFLSEQLEVLLDGAKEIPAVNQIEFHPWLQQPALQTYCHSRNIALCAWSPLMRGRCFSDPVLQTLAGVHGKTIAQIVLRWELQKGIAVIPKTTHPDRMAENASVFDFELSPADMLAIDRIDRNQRSGADPASF